jgi:hypothetical protein
MPLRSFFKAVEPGSSQPVYTAEAGDVEVTIATLPLPGQSQSSSGYNFYVGGPELAVDGGGGLYVMTSQFSTEVDEGDEIWVAVPKQEIAWSAVGVPLTVLVRSRRQKPRPAGEKTRQATR